MRNTFCLYALSLRSFGGNLQPEKKILKGKILVPFAGFRLGI